MWFWRLQLVLKEKKINKGFFHLISLQCKFQLCSYAVSSIRRWPHMDGLVDFFYAHGHLVKELILSQSVSSIVEHGLLFPDVGCLLGYVRPVPSPES